MGDGGQLRLLRREALDGDLELAPSFVGAGKGRLGEGWFARVGGQSQRSGLAGYPHKVGGNRDKRGGLTLNGILKRRVQVVDDLGEDVGRSLVAILVQDMQPQAPFSNGELIHGRLVGAGGRQYSLPARGRQRREAAYTMCWSVTTLTFRCGPSARFLVNRIFVVFRLGAMAREGGSDACCARARTRETRCVARAETGGRFAGARARGKKRVERKRAAEQNRNATSRAAASRRRGAQIRSPELLTRTLGCRPAGARQRATITAGSEFTSPSHLGGTQDRKRRTARAADVFRLTSTNMITPLFSFSFIPSSSVPLRPRATRPARSNKKFLHAAIQTRGAQESRAQDQCICI